jgi:RNA-binding protein
MTTPTTRELKARAQKLNPVIRIGRDGLSENLVAAMDQALNNHGLVKARFTECKDQRRELSSELAERTSSRLVLLVGHTATFYRQPTA